MNKEQLRPMLWLVFLSILGLLWFKWNEFTNPKPVVTTPATTTSIPNTALPTGQMSASGVPSVISGAISDTIPNTSTAYSGEVIDVETDLLKLKISLQGGNLIEAQLKNYSQSIDDPQLVQLLSTQTGKVFTLESALMERRGETGYPLNNTARYSSEKSSYNLESDTLSIPLRWEENGLIHEKIYHFSRGTYQVKLEQKITNTQSQARQIASYRQLKREPVKKASGLAGINTFTGAAYSHPGKNYGKLDFGDLADDEPLKIEDTGGWIGMLEHYFAVGVVPNTNSKNRFYSGNLGNNLFGIGLLSEYQNIAPQQTLDLTDTIYIGPKIKKNLLAVAPNFEQTLDYGPLFFFSEWLFKLLNFIHGFLGNWGWAIVITTLLIKIAFFPLAAKSFKSMAKMRKVQPEMERIRKNFEGDRHLLGQEMMKLYKREGINPASGCLPVLVQIPVFIAFYYMLMETIELRQAPWMAWITDLSVRDKFYVLPVINGVLMFVQQKLNPPPSDPMQQKVLMALPVVFSVLFLVFPSGLVLYWVISNLFSIIQHYVINKKYSH